MFHFYCIVFQPKKLFKRAAFASVYFDEDGAFLAKSFDERLGRTLTRRQLVLKPNRDLLAFLGRNAGDDIASLRSLHTLLLEMFSLDPSKRIKPENALNHRFCTGN